MLTLRPGVTLAIGARKPRAAPRVCALAECNARSKRLGWCEKHYRRWRVHGDPRVVLTPVSARLMVPR